MGEVTFSERVDGERVTLLFYVGPREEGIHESARARAVVRTQMGGAAEMDRMAQEWLDARGLFNLSAFRNAMVVEAAELDAADAAEMAG
jgi:hypothetical protein